MDPVWARLRRLARRHGVELSYRDSAGRRQIATPESLAAVLSALGLPEEHWKRSAQAGEEGELSVLPPVTVLWPGEPADVPWLVAPPPGEVEGGVIEEAGREHAARLQFSAAGCLRLPWQLPLGYHRLWVIHQGRRRHSQLVVAPRQAYLPSRSRSWGAFIPTYALRSWRNWGGGDLGDLAELAQWVGEAGGSVVGTLPLLATFLDQPFDPSPYAPASRLFWNELYLALDQLPEWPGSSLMDGWPSHWQRWRTELQRAPWVDYRAVSQLRRQVLEVVRQRLERQPGRRLALEEWVRAHPRVREYAALRQARAAGQDPAGVRPSQGYQDASPEQAHHLYVQWNLEEQLARLFRGRAGLYMDFPLGVHPASYDQWRYPDLFAPASVGAPPDAFFSQGQNWGFSPLVPRANRAEGWAYLRACLGHQLRYARALRLDHVAWLERLFWIPRGGSPADGLYVRYPRRELYAILCLESQRHQALLVGEDLGTMPPGLGRGMVDRHIQRMYVLGLDPKPRRLLVPRSRLVSLNTHDLPPFAAFWQGVGARGQKRWRRWLRVEGRGRGAALAGALRWLATSRARLLLVNLEDLWGEAAPQNRPGTGEEAYPNWRRKAAWWLPAITQHPGLRAWLRRLEGWRQAQGDRLP